MNKKTLKSYGGLLKEINKKNLITEKQVNRIKNGLKNNYDDVSNLLEKNNFKYHYNLTSEHQKKGKDYLIKKHLKLNGLQRITSNIDDDNFINAIKKLYDGRDYLFTFDGFKEITNGFCGMYVPIYTLYIDGLEVAYFHYNGFDYVASTSAIIQKSGYTLYAYTY